MRKKVLVTGDDGLEKYTSWLMEQKKSVIR